MEGLWRGKGGGQVGDRWGSGASDGSLHCAILAQNPLFPAIVNQQSLTSNPLPFPAQVRTAFQLLSRCCRGTPAPFRLPSWPA